MTPRVCDGSLSADCAYDFGWYAAQHALTGATQAIGPLAVSLPWWLDVETADSWSTDAPTNAADLEGVVASLRSMGVSNVGVYSTPRQWAAIVGVTTSSAPSDAPFGSPLDWVSGAHDLNEAPASAPIASPAATSCSSSIPRMGSTATTPVVTPSVPGRIRPRHRDALS